MGHWEGWEEQRFPLPLLQERDGAWFNTCYLDQDSCAILSFHTNFFPIPSQIYIKKSFGSVIKTEQKSNIKYICLPLLPLPPSRKSKPQPILAPTPFF